MRNLFIAIGINLALLVATSIQSFAAEHYFRVRVEVSGDANIKPLVTSYINRELRTLNDVKIMDNDPGWLLSIVAIETYTKGGDKIGVALSVVVLKLVTSLFAKKIPLALVGMVPELYLFHTHILYTDSTNNLQRTCKRIVADFDSEQLETARRVLREANELSEEMKRKFEEEEAQREIKERSEIKPARDE